MRAELPLPENGERTIAPDPLTALRKALERHLASLGLRVDFDAELPAPPVDLRAMRTIVEERVEQGIALLDLLDGDPDLEDGADAELSFCGLSVSWPSPDDREHDDEREPEEHERDTSPEWTGEGEHRFTLWGGHCE